MATPSAATTPFYNGPLQWRELHCTDVDDQAAALPGWRQQYQQLSPGRFSGSLRHATIDVGCTYFCESNNRLLAETVSPPRDTMTFALHAQFAGQAQIDDATFGHDDIACLNGGHDTTVTLPGDTQLSAIVVPLSVLDKHSAPLSGDEAIWQRQRAAVVRSSMAPLLRAFVDQVLSVARDNNAALLGPQAQRALCSATISNLTLAMTGEDTGETATPITARRRWQIVQRARRHIEDHLGDVFSVADVCKAIGASRRTLQYCFEEVLQINPVAYVRAVRLNAVRRDLKQADPAHESVANVAARCGFWHLGHFAADYRRMFGEPPSTTLYGTRHQRCDRVSIK